MDEQQQVNYPGRPVTLGGKRYIIPSLSIGDAKRLWPQIMSLGKIKGPEELTQQWEIGIEAIYCALRRNYPEITKDQVESMISARDYYDVYVAVALESGIMTTVPTGGIGPVDGELDASATKPETVV